MKIWCISDTHSKHNLLTVPDEIDMVIFAGDAGTVKDPYNNEWGIRNFLMWYESLKIKHKVLIFGNHDTSVEKGLISQTDIEARGIVYLNHEMKEVDGLKIFGSPYTPSFGEGWAYNVKRNRLDAYWAEIEEGTDIVVTHGPPLGILDHTQSGAYDAEKQWGNTAVVSCGDKSLLNHMQRVQPLLHVYGHIHPESRCNNHAIVQLGGLRTRFVNAAVLDLNYELHNNGHIIKL